LTSYGRRFVELAGSLGPSDANNAAEETVRLYKIIEENVFDKGFDALITPTVATTTIRPDFDPTRSALVIDGAPVDPYSGWFLTSVFSLLNWLPVINVPAGHAANGVPTGIQIVTPPYEEVRCYEIAAAYASATEPLPFVSELDLQA
jgi:Asp-tRNA(Asn)/Glu-tRNA(Gln) amidotransferase A subunit family amidase